MNKTCFALVAASVTVLAGCANDMNNSRITSYTALSNPAALHCAQQDGELETVTENDVRVTYCLLPKGERIEQWDYYNQSQKSE